MPSTVKESGIGTGSLLGGEADAAPTEPKTPTTAITATAANDRLNDMTTPLNVRAGRGRPPRTFPMWSKCPQSRELCHPARQRSMGPYVAAGDSHRVGPSPAEKPQGSKELEHLVGARGCSTARSRQSPRPRQPRPGHARRGRMPRCGPPPGCRRTCGLAGAATDVGGGCQPSWVTGLALVSGRSPHSAVAGQTAARGRPTG